jgi:hypothetical protein
LLDVPASQLLQVASPPALLLPASHGKHAPPAVLYCPLLQFAHAIPALEDFPAAQLVQEAEPAELS